MLIFIIWLGVVFKFSAQNGAESGKLSEKVTRKLLETKDKAETIIENYKLTHSIQITRN